MVKKCAFDRVFAAGSMLAALTGCTLDGLVVLKHPASVAPAASFSVGAVDVILNVGSAQAAGDSIYRDSLHIGVGLPDGWTVESAKACPASHFRPAKASVNGLDTNRRNQLLLDTLDACEGRAVPLFPDSGVRAFLAGRTLRVNASPDSLGRSFSLRPDTVPHWFGYRGSIEVSVPAGQAPDTVLDTNAFKALPVYVYLTLKAGNRDTSVRILYFSKTGPLDTVGFGSGANQDKGSLVFRPLAVGAPVSTHPGNPAGFRWVAGGPSILRGSSGSLSLSLHRRPGESGGARDGRGLEIRSASGTLLRAWTAASLDLAGGVEWDGTDAEGRPLPAGRYLLCVSGAGDGGSARAVPFALLP